MDSAHTWHPGETNLEPVWPIPVSLLPNESISSWLVRAALVHRCSPGVFARWLWPGWRAWTTDVDRGVSEDRLQVLERHSGIRADTFQNAALVPIASRIEGKAPSPKLAWRWILTRGPVTAWRQGTAQYCPECLSADRIPHHRLPWRFAWHTGCARHHVALVDRCPGCGSAVLFYRLGQGAPHVALCALCEVDLRRAERPAYSLEALSFQNMADRAVRDGEAICFGETLRTVDWFSVAHFFATLLRRSTSHPTKAANELLQLLGVEPPFTVPPVPGARIERLQTRDRQKILERVWRITSSNVDRLRDAVEQSRISQQGLCEKGQRIPEALVRILPPLPEKGRAKGAESPRRRCGPRGRGEVIRMMKRLERTIAHEQR